MGLESGGVVICSSTSGVSISMAVLRVEDICGRGRFVSR